MRGQVSVLPNGAGVIELRVGANGSGSGSGGGGGGSMVELHTFGAHITKWQQHREPPLLFLSSKAVLDGSKAIRGGIPLIFPQFGPRGPLVQHGFARNSVWTLTDQKVDEGVAQVTLSLESSPKTLELWPHAFETSLTVTLRGASPSQLDVVWNVRNLSDQESFTFANALHTYFNVGDIDKVSLSNLEGCRYIDNLQNGQSFSPNEGTIVFDREVDRIYLKCPRVLRLRDDSLGRTIIIRTSESLPDAVAWNPWIEKSKNMSDFDDDEYKVMVCVEAGAIEPQVQLGPGQSYCQSMILSYETT